LLQNQSFYICYKKYENQFSLGIFKVYYIKITKVKIFVFDTETTGFINKKDANLKKQPHIVQFA
jgi:hypothetical protein